MTIVQLGSRKQKVNSFALFNMGFRPFFLGGIIFAILSIAMWMAVYAFYYQLPIAPLLPTQWHSHEMIYGYTMAIIAGFLLTAIVNWTGIQTVQGAGLVGLFVLWLVPRILFLFGVRFIFVAAVFDLLFMMLLLVAISIPIVKSKNWKQLGIISKIVLMTLGNIVFYLGAFGLLEKGIYWGIYGGLYLIIALILTIGSRVMPAFISNGVGYKIDIKNPKWVMILNLILFAGFFYSELFAHSEILTAILSICLFSINSYRLCLWHTIGIWKKPLLWGLYLAFLFISIGFLLFALSYFIGISKFIAIHAFAIGGIGLATMAMMARVTLGHTGRNIFSPPRGTGLALGLLIWGIIFRLFVPLINNDGYVFWIFLAQIFWILAFSLLAFLYSRMLFSSRIDGKEG